MPLLLLTVIIDIGTGRRAGPHADLPDRLGATPAPQVPAPFAASCRQVGREGRDCPEIWHEASAVGLPLPMIPLGLKAGPGLPLDLDATCDRTCREWRIAAHGA